jgi:hypothetical protein
LPHPQLQTTISDQHGHTIKENGLNKGKRKTTKEKEITVTGRKNDNSSGILKTNQSNQNPDTTIDGKKVKFKNINNRTRTKNHKTPNNSNQTPEIHIMYVNANGITGKKDSLTTALKAHNTDIATIVETKLAGEPPNIEGYRWITKNITGKK